MSATVFCPAPHCQRQRPYTVGEDGMRRCGYCKRELGREEGRMEEIGAQTEIALEPVLSRLARLEMRADAAAKTDQDMSDWLLKVQEQVKQVVPGAGVWAADMVGRLDGLAAAVNALLTRVTALEAAVAAELAPLPSMPVSPPGGKKKSSKKPARSR